VKPSKDKIPRLAQKILLRFLREDLAEEVLGDLEEKFFSEVKSKSVFRASVNYWYQVIHYVRPFAIRKSRSFYLISYDMFRNNFKIAIRSLWKNKALSSINIFGLTVGLSSSFLIALYIHHEISFDKFQLKGDRIVRVIMEYGLDGGPEKKRGNYTSTKVAPVFSRTFPEVESAVRMTDRDIIVRYEDKLITEANFMYADSSFFDVFTCHFLQGNPATALDGFRKVVLTESTARKYFSDERPVGKILLIGVDNTPYEITGVIKDYPENSQIRFDFLTSFCSLGANQEETYFDANYTTYLLLNDANSRVALQEKVTAFMRKEMAGSGASINYLLEPFPEIHLYSQYSGFVPTTSINYIYILSIVALLILVIACFTYINLSIARSIERAREVGIRKVVGAARSQLFWQFIGESGILFIASMIFSFAVALFILPYFNLLADRRLSIEAFFSLDFLFLSMIVCISISVLAGSYPAVILSGLQPIKVLKGLFRNTTSGKWVQHSLIVFQFAISAFLIVSTVVIQKQLYFIQHKNLGYDREHVLVLPMNQRMLKDLTVIKQELKSNPDIIGVSSTNSTPVKIAGGYGMRSDMMAETEHISVTANPIDEDYIKATGLQIIYGNDLTEQDLIDVTTENVKDRIYHFILNESAARQLGWEPEAAVGKKMFMSDRSGVVKGVIKDFHFESLHQAIKPLVLFPEIRARLLLVKVNGLNLSRTISFIEDKWKLLIPYTPFEYRFLDDDYAKLYRAELQLGIVMNLFAAIAIILACLGLFGLSAYVVQQRVKEISIRKILGASLYSIVSLLSRSFTRLLVVSILIALPAAYLFVKTWLLDFEYQVELKWWIFALPGVLAVAIAMMTVSIQSIKAAIENPVENLRSE